MMREFAVLLLLALATGCATIRRADYAVTPAGLDVVADVDAMGPVQVGMVASPAGVQVCAAPALSSAPPVCVWAELRAGSEP